MLLNEETLQSYDYSIENLSVGSNKNIKVKCDYCGVVYDTTLKRRNKSNQLVDKDACGDCKYIKRAEATKAKYGVDNVAKVSHIKEKIQEKNKARLSSSEYRQHLKQVMKEKYGCEHSMQSPELRQRFRKTCLKRYGVDNPLKSEQIKQKGKDTCLQKYGVEYVNQSNEGKQKILEGYRKKYGVDNIFQTDETKEKIRQFNISKYGVDHPMKIEDIAKQRTKKAVLTKVQKGTIKLYKNKTIHQYALDSEFSISYFYKLVHKHGLDVALSLVPYESSIETIISQWLDKTNIIYEKQKRLDNRLADFYIPSHNLIIECDGLYWHSDAILDNDYHIKKRQLYLDNNYTPLFFREDEINNKFPIVQSIILNKLGRAEKLNARDYEVKEVSSNNAKNFLAANHLMGKGRGTAYGLYDGDKLISLMQIYPKQGDQYEISRFCSVLNKNVRGAFSRLLSHLKHNVNPRPSSIITFIDLRYGRGKYLEILGFQFQSSYPSFRWTNGSECFHRLKFPGNSGYEKGFLKIWDCGQAKYVLND
jgi:very-short-patch-repair endonuclease